MVSHVNHNRVGDYRATSMPLLYESFRFLMQVYETALCKNEMGLWCDNETSDLPDVQPLPWNICVCVCFFKLQLILKNIASICFHPYDFVIYFDKKLVK